MELNQIPQNPNNWGNVADLINENSGKIEAETAKLNNATTKFKGYFSTSTTLSAKWPSPLVGDTAWVGETYPGVVYRCNVAGTWLATTDVPSVATVNLSEYYKLSDVLDKLKLNISTAQTLTNIGEMAWNTETETAELKISNEVTMSIGQELFVKAKNTETTSILNGTPVYISGAQGGLKQIKKASNLTDISEKTIGLATQDITASASGIITTMGEVHSLNTSAFAEGALIWLGANGTLTTTKPVDAPYHIIIGVCTRSHATEGSIFVSVKESYRAQIDQLRSDLNEIEINKLDKSSLSSSLDLDSENNAATSRVVKLLNDKVEQVKDGGLEDGSIELNKLSPTLTSYIGSGGAVTNQADDDDLENTIINDIPVIREKTTKTYNPENYSGMGRVILRKNMVNGVNVLTQDKMTQSNTIYEIRYDFDLNGAAIIIPKNCILKFEGGFISNGTIIGNNTSIKADALKIFGAGITITNVWNIVESYPEWFGAVGDGVTDDYDAFRKCISLGGNIKLLAKEYYIEGQFAINKSVSIIGEGSNEESSPSILSFGAPNGLAAITIDANVTYYTTGTPLVIRDCIIQPKNWTVHKGMGLDICRTIHMKNVVVQKFKRTNLFLHHDNTQEGPYNSVFEQCKFCFSGEHGAVIGRGANSLTFIYCAFHWNGASAYGQYVSSQGDYDGLLITSKDSYIPNMYSYADNSFYPSFTVQAINLIGGAACHNSRYGYNISNLEDSNFVNVGYAERNYAGLGQTASQDTHQIYIGNGCRNCSFFINYVLMQALDTFAFEHRFSVRICFLGKIYEGRYKQLMSGTLTGVDTKVLASATDVDVTREITSSSYVEKATCSNGKNYVKRINDYIEVITGLENTITGHILNAIGDSLEVFYTVDSSHPISTLNNYFQTANYKRYKIRKCNLGNSATKLTLGTDKIIDVSFGTIKNGTIDLNGAKIVPDYNSLINSSLTILGFPGEGTIYYQNGKLTLSNGSRWNEADGAKAGVARSGVSADRPAGNYIYVGFKFFDIKLGKPIYASVIADSSPYTVTWVDSTGTTV